MTWTYGGAPGADPRDTIRFTLGDIAETRQSLSDEELTYLLAEYTPAVAAIEAAHAMATRFAGLSATSKKVGDLSLSVDYGATASRYDALAERLRRKGLERTFLPVMSDESYAEGAFSIGMDDYAD